MLQLLMLEDRTVLSTLTVLNNADNGAGSLRATLAAAQSGDTIVFDNSLGHETISLTSGPLALSSSLTIDGLGSDLLAISGNQHSRILELSGSAQVTLSNLTLTEGVSSQGGAVLIGGNASLILDGDILSDNQAVGDTHGNALGGAVFNSAAASLTVHNTLFMNNQSNGMQESFGGALANAGTLAIDGATFTGNAALGSTTPVGTPPGGSQGGAIGNLDASTATIKGSTFTGNQALGNGAGAARGGAICNEDAVVFPFTGTGIASTISQCTFENNSAKAGSTAADGGYGGAIGNNPGVNLAVLNCSFTGNQANSGGGSTAVGGAIVDWLGDSVTISDSHFINNSAIGSSNGAQAEGGAVGNIQTMTISNSLFAGNSASGGAMADGTNTSGQALGGAIVTGFGAVNNVTVILTISDCIVANNEAIGGSGGSTLANPRADGAAGGGILNVRGGTLNVAACTITGNQAIGGASAQGSGGPALGGGIDNNNQGTLNLTNSTVSVNLCQGGQGAGDSAGGVAAGGGIGNDRASSAAITNCTISLNETLGGVGGAGANGGPAVGAGIENGVFAFAWGVADASSLSVSNCAIFGNMAQGGTSGSAGVGGDGLGGGLFAGSGTMVIDAVLVNGNQSQGGADSQGNTSGNGLGGGVYVDPSAAVTAKTQSIIAGNHASKDNDDVWGTINPPP
jgi:hypothetical protein